MPGLPRWILPYMVLVGALIIIVGAATQTHLLERPGAVVGIASFAAWLLDPTRRADRRSRESQRRRD